MEESAHFLLCVQSKDKMVIKQNAMSKSLCGNHQGEQCAQCPLEEIQLSEGLHLLKNQGFFGKIVDITIAKEKEQQWIMIYPKTDKIKEMLNQLEGITFTKRQSELLLLILEGKTNPKILSTLVISKATLKTHLNQLYKKAPQLKIFREELNS